LKRSTLENRWISSKSDSETQATDLISDLFRLYRHLSPRRRMQLGGVLALMLLGAIGELVTLGAVLPFLTIIADPSKAFAYPLFAQAFDALGWTDPDDLLLPSTLVFAAIALCAGGVRLLLTWTSQKFVFRLGYDLGVEVYRRTLYQPYSYHVARNTSELVAGINKIQMILTGMLVPLMQGITGAVLSLFIMAALVVIDARTAFIAAAGFGTIYAAVSYATRRRLRANSKIISETQARRVQAVQEGLGGIRDVLLDRAQPVFVNRFARLDSQFRDAQAMNAFISAAPRFIVEASGMVLIAVLAFALSRQPGGLISALPILGALALGAQRMLPLLQQIYNGWSQIAGSHHMLTDVLRLVDLPIELNEASRSPTKPLSFQQAITFQSVSFRYAPDQPPVLNNVTLTIRKGDRIGIIGKTGSGKSTLVDLVMGLLQPTDGAIRVDGELLGSPTVKHWQAQIAHVPQTIYLSDASVAENIAFGVPLDRIDFARVAEAARQAKLDEFINGLPNGYRTIVGERGVRLSGGQRQRIGIARALYKSAPVLILDEATSALDMETESAVMAAIEELDRDLTILIIAHRLSTLNGCDAIVRLEAGNVVELPMASARDTSSATSAFI